MALRSSKGRRKEDVVDTADPELKSLAGVKLTTWGKVIPAILWLGALSAGVRANSIQITHVIEQKADKEAVERDRRADSEVINGKLDTLIAKQQAIVDRVKAIEDFQREQVRLALQAQEKTR